MDNSHHLTVNLPSSTTHETYRRFNISIFHNWGMVHLKPITTRYSKHSLIWPLLMFLSVPCEGYEQRILKTDNISEPPSPSTEVSEYISKRMITPSLTFQKQVSHFSYWNNEWHNFVGSRRSRSWLVGMSSHPSQTCLILRYIPQVLIDYSETWLFPNIYHGPTQPCRSF